MELVPGFEAKTALQFEIRVFGTMHYKLWKVGALLHCKFRGIENTNSLSLSALLAVQSWSGATL